LSFGHKERKNEMNHLTILIVFITIIVVFVLYNRLTNTGIRSVTAAQAQDLIQDSGVLILDVRTPHEFREGHIKGAKLLPVTEISGRIAEIAPWKDRKVLVYCRSGSRSVAACRTLDKNGFKRLTNLNGGIMSWTGRGFKTVQ
jgi:rhodanese-related sulfurtransferase